MGMLMLKCPTAGQDFSAGIHVEEDCFRTLPDAVSEAQCPHCGSSHSWRTGEAHFADRIAPSQWAALGKAS
jgi:hypothetical protein